MKIERKRIRQRRKLIYKFVLKLKDKIISSLTLRIRHNRVNHQKYGIIEVIFTHRAYCGNGFAHSLVRSALTFAESIGCYKLVTVPNKSEIMFCQKVGFTQKGDEFCIQIPNNTSTL